MKLFMSEQEKEQLVEIRFLARILAAGSHNQVNTLAALIMELAKSHTYCDVAYVHEKLNLLFSEERVKWHTEKVGED